MDGSPAPSVEASLNGARPPEVQDSLGAAAALGPLAVPLPRPLAQGGGVPAPPQEPPEPLALESAGSASASVAEAAVASSIAQQCQDLVTEAVKEHIKDTLKGIREDQSGIIVRMEAIWALLERLLNRLGGDTDGRGTYQDRTSSGSSSLCKSFSGRTEEERKEAPRTEAAHEQPEREKRLPKLALSSVVGQVLQVSQGMADADATSELPISRIHSASAAEDRARSIAAGSGPTAGPTSRLGRSSHPRLANTSTRTPSLKTVDIYNLDSMHTDQLMELQGLSSRHASSNSKASGASVMNAAKAVYDQARQRASHSNAADSSLSTTPGPVPATSTEFANRASTSPNLLQHMKDTLPHAANVRRRLSSPRQQTRGGPQDPLAVKYMPEQAAEVRCGRDDQGNKHRTSRKSVSPTRRPENDSASQCKGAGVPGSASEQRSISPPQATAGDSREREPSPDGSLLSGSSNESPGGKSHASSRPSQAWRNCPGSMRVATIQSLDVYNLDAMHTDHLFEANGLNRQVSGMSRGQASPQRCKVAPNDPKAEELSFTSVSAVPRSPGSAAERAEVQLNVILPLPQQNLGDASAGDASAGSKQSSSWRLAARCNSATRDVMRKNSSPLGAITGMSGMDALRAEHESMLVAQTTSVGSSESSETKVGRTWSLRPTFSTLLLRLPHFILCVFGVVPFQVGFLSTCYRNLSLICVALLVVQSVVLATQETSLLYMHMTSACYAVGGFLGVVTLRAQRVHNLLGPYHRPLEQYASIFGFLNEWRQVSLRRMLVVGLLWVYMVASRVAGSKDETCRWAVHSAGSYSSIASFCLISGLLATLTCCQLHVCCCLELMIDKFCIRFLNDDDLPQGICEWNVLQAILRRSAHTIDSSFLALNTSVLATLLLTGVEVLQGAGNSLRLTGPGSQCAAFWCGWVLSPVVLVLFTVFRAAQVTEKCSRVPALVNSWTFEDRQIDHGRQYVVQYITHSAAGFYVKGVRLSAYMALKLMYIFGGVLFTMVTVVLKV